MNFCSISQKQIDSLYILVKSNLDDGRTTSIKDTINMVYNKVMKSTSNEEQALTYAGLVPSSMIQNLESDKNTKAIYDSYKIDVNELSDLKIRFDNIDEVRDYINQGKPRVEIPESPLTEIPPTDSGSFIPSITLPKGKNIISILVDRAREKGQFIHETINPKEIEMDGSKPKVDEHRILLKTLTDKNYLRHHRIIEMLDKIIREDKDGSEIAKYKLKLQFIDDDNKEWFLKRDAKSNSILAVLTDDKGEYLYFDEGGNLSIQELGMPFAMEYEDTFYTKDKLNISRNSLQKGSAPTSISPQYEGDTNPLMTVVSLLHSKIPVTASIIGITAGTLSGFNNNNTLATSQQEESQYTMRTLQQLLDDGDIEEYKKGIQQDITVKIDGFYIDYDPVFPTDQRIKIGRPMLYDSKSQYYIPLTGKKLRDVTFEGTKIGKDTQLYEIIDILDKTGEITVNTLRPDKTRILSNQDDLVSVYKFLKRVIYSKNFPIQLLGDSIKLNRNSESIRANSLWDQEINYVRGGSVDMNVPLSNGFVTLSFDGFLKENFLTGAAPAVITKNDVRFAKVNKRVIFQLDKDYKELQTMLNSGANASPITEVVVGDKIFPKSDNTRLYEVTGIDEGRISIMENGSEKEQTISLDSLKRLWIKAQVVKEPEKVAVSEFQEMAIKKIKSIPTLPRIAGRISATSLIRPTSIPKESKVHPANVVGNAIDYLGKMVFSDKTIQYSDMVNLNGISSTIGGYFKSKAHMDEVIKKISDVKNNLQSQGYVFLTGIKLYDPESNISGEIDLIMVDKDGRITISDFKTSASEFDGSYMGKAYDNVTNQQYFATQGFIYSMLLGKQIVANISTKTNILGITVSYTDEVNPLDTKIVGVRGVIGTYEFQKSQVAPFYKDVTTPKQLVDIYTELVKQDAVNRSNDISKRTGKPLSGGSLLMSIGEVKEAAAGKDTLLAEINHLSKMFGEEFVVNFVNQYNSERYGDWDIKGTNLYNNAIKGTAYHEGWHKFSQLFLTVDQKLKLYKSLRDKAIAYKDRNNKSRNTKNDTDLDIEEMLADEWVKYVKSPSSYKFPEERVIGIMGLFKKLWRLIKDWFGGTSRPLDLFKDLYNGNLSHYTKDINNAIWGKLNSSILNDDNQEIVNHSRTNLYISSTSYFIGKILRDNNLSFSWLTNNFKSNKLKDLIRDEYIKLLDDRLTKLAIPVKENQLSYLLENTGEVINASVRRGLTPGAAAKFVGQIMEINGILDDESGGFDNFYTYYTRNSDIDSIRDKGVKMADGLETTFDMDEVKMMMGDVDETEELGDDDDPESKGKNNEFGKGPNEEKAFDKANKEIQDFFRTMPIINSINADGSYNYLTNELGVPETYDYASIFNKTKSILESDFTIEEILATLSNPHIQKSFPQAKFIKDELEKYMIGDKAKAENFSFIQRFVRVMSLAEINNIELTVNFDNVSMLAQDSERTATKMRSLSRIGEAQEVRKWEANFRTPLDSREETKPSDTSTLNYLFNSTDRANILYNIDGVLVLNPFYNYNDLRTKVSTKEFLEIMGINLEDGFWNNTEISPYADSLREVFINNLNRYKEYADYKLNNDYIPSGMSPEAFRENNVQSREIVETIVRSDIFIPNPIQYFRERRILRMGPGNKEIKSMIYAMEDVAKQNSLYSMVFSSKSFTDGAGKLKWPFYETSLLAYRTHLLNKINEIKEFDSNIEYSTFNPNTMPWLRNSLFYKAMFNDSGKRNTVSHQLMNAGSPISNQRVRIELADLSSYKTVINRKYATQHPKNLNGQDKLFFDVVTLLTDGRIEIARASTSSSIMSVRMNSYDAGRSGTGFTPKFLPIDFNNNISISRVDGKNYIGYPPIFHAIMRNYLVADLSKLKWYYDNNPSHKMASKLNVFSNILDNETAKNLIDQVTELTGNLNQIHSKISDIVEDNTSIIKDLVTEFFSDYAAKLYNGKDNANLMGMSEDQRSVLTNLNDTYGNKIEVTSAQEKIRETQDNKAGSSIQLTAKEKQISRLATSLNKIAAVYAANQFILNVEYHTWYMGDNYLFSNPFKRGNLTTNTGILAIVSENTNRMMNDLKGDTMYSMLSGDKSYKDYRMVKTSVISDVVTNSRNLPTMISDLMNYEKLYKLFPSETDTERIARISATLTPYSKITAADGQAKIGLDAYRAYRRIFGTWNEDKDEKEYQRQLAFLRLHLNQYKSGQGDYINNEGIIVTQKEQDERVTKGPAFSTFAPQKWSYTGPEIMRDKSGKQITSPMHTKFDKTSLHPLLPEVLLGKGLPDEKLMMEMAMDDVDYVKFESASKAVKHDSILAFFNEYGENNDVRLDDASPEWLLSSYLKNQLSTDKPPSTDNTLGSQQRVMVFDVKYLPEVQANPAVLRTIQNIENNYLSAIDNIMNFQKKQFYNRFGLEETGSGQTRKIEIVDEDRFAAGISSLAKSNNFPTNMMEYLEYDPATKDYRYDPSLVFLRKMLIDTIGGIIDGDLRRLKLKGTASIQVTSVGTSKQPFTNPTEEQIKKYGSNGLHYYHYEYNQDGSIARTSTMGVKITMQGDFKNLYKIGDPDGKKIGNLNRLNEGLAMAQRGSLSTANIEETRWYNWKQANIDKLTFYGYRIPTNNNNFIDHIEVMEFLPESTSNIIIGPPEHIIKSGSDFDVDKMNFIFPSIDEDGDLTKLHRVKIEEYIDNEGVTSAKQVVIKVPSIEQLYAKLNNITSSIRDYKDLQKQFKQLAKQDNKDYKAIVKFRNDLQNTLSLRFSEVDSVVYNQMFNDKNLVFNDILTYFQDVTSTDEELQKLINNYKYLNEKAKQDKSFNENKVDRDFQSALSDLNKYKDHYTNDMLMALKDLLKQPAYLQLLLAPSNTEYLLDEAARIGNLTGRKLSDNLSSTENMTGLITNKKHSEFLGANIGTWSIQRRWYSLLNFSKMELNRSWKYSDDSMRIHMPLVASVDRGEIGNLDIVRMYGNNIDGISPRDLWDQFMSLTIDLPSNTSYTLFGINKQNSKIIQYLIASRYSLPAIMDFINQPILQKAYDMYATQSKNMPNYSLKHALLDVAREVGLDRELIQMYTADAVKNKPFTPKNIADIDIGLDFFTRETSREKGKEGIVLGANPFVKNPGIFASRILSTENFEEYHFSPEDMQRDIEGENSTTAAYKDRQRKILLYFMTVELEAGQMSGMQFAFSEDRNKDTNYYTIENNNNKQRQYRGAKYDNLPVDGSMFSKSAMSKLENRSIYSMFTYSDVAQLFYQKFAQDFTTFNMSQSIMKLLDTSNAYGIDKQLLATRIEGDFIEMIYKNYGNFKIDLYDPFEDKITPSTQSFSRYFIQNIFNFEKVDNFKTYSANWIKMISLYPELKERVEFVKRMQTTGIMERPEKEEGNNPLDKYAANVIRFIRSENNTIQERNFYAKQFENLIHFNPSELGLTESYSSDDVRKISAFFTEMAYLTLYQAGPTNIADNFSDLLPFYMWENFVNGAFANYKKALANAEITEREVLLLFNMMYTENNPKVSWKNPKTIYDLRYYGRKLTKAESDIVRKEGLRKATKYFLNFTAGKMYSIKLFAYQYEYNPNDLTC